MKFKGLDYYQKQYNQLKAIAESSINSGVEFDESFERELLALTKLVKSLGGKL